MTEAELHEHASTGVEMHEIGTDEELTGDGTGQALPPAETAEEAAAAAEEEDEGEPKVDES